MTLRSKQRPNTPLVAFITHNPQMDRHLIQDLLHKKVDIALWTPAKKTKKDPRIIWCDAKKEIITHAKSADYFIISCVDYKTFKNVSEVEKIIAQTIKIIPKKTRVMILSPARVVNKKEYLSLLNHVEKITSQIRQSHTDVRSIYIMDYIDKHAINPVTPPQEIITNNSRFSGNLTGSRSMIPLVYADSSSHICKILFSRAYRKKEVILVGHREMLGENIESLTQHKQSSLAPTSANKRQTQFSSVAITSQTAKIEKIKNATPVREEIYRLIHPKTKATPPKKKNIKKEEKKKKIIKPKHIGIIGVGLLIWLSWLLWPFVLLKYYEMQTKRGWSPTSIQTRRVEKTKTAVFNRLKKSSQLEIDTLSVIRENTTQKANSVHLAAQLNNTIEEAQQQSQQIISTIMGQGSGVGEKVNQLHASLEKMVFVSQQIESSQREQYQQGLQLAQILKSIANAPQANITAIIQNNQELRPTGGFISGVALATLKQGQISSIEYKDVYDLDAQLNGAVQSPPEIAQELGESAWYLRDANWDPDFIKTATQVEWFVDKQIGRQTDIVVGLNLSTLTKLLEVLEKVTLPDGKVVTAKNIEDVVLRNQEIQPRQDSTIKSEILSSITAAVIKKIEDNPGRRGIITTILDQLILGEIMLYASDEHIQQMISQAGWAGEIANTPCQGVEGSCVGDYVYLVETNTGINKTNQHVSREMQITTDTRTTQVDVQIHNSAPSNDWPLGSYKAYLRAYLPQQVTLESLVIDGISLSGSQYTQKITQNKLVVAFRADIKPMSSADVSIKYQHPKRMIESTPYQYHLRIQEQPGKQPTPTSITLIAKNAQIASGPTTATITTDTLTHEIVNDKLVDLLVDLVE